VKRAVITGGRGFAGRHLEVELGTAGYDVVALDRGDAFDVTDRDGGHHVFAALKPTVVFHLAAFAHVGASWDAPVAVWRVNTEGTLNVLDAARDADVHRVVVIGSAEEYGRVDKDVDRVDENAPLRPMSPYGASKVAADYLALQAWLGNALETIRVRPFNHTGAGQTGQFLAPALAQRVAAAERDEHDVITVGNVDPVRELLDVRDVVRAYRLLAEHGTPGEAYNVCAGVGYQVGELAATMLSLARRPLRLEVDPALVRPVEVPRLVGDPAKLMAATGWIPEHTLAETLATVLDAARV
jgi:GDP-4-dehydro-6-deoxy-D-mannose reductase